MMATTEQTTGAYIAWRTLAAIVLAFAVQLVVSAVTTTAFLFFGAAYHLSAPAWGETVATAAGSGLGV